MGGKDVRAGAWEKDHEILTSTHDMATAPRTAAVVKTCAKTGV